MNRALFSANLGNLRQSIAVDMVRRSTMGKRPHPDHERKLLTIGLLLAQSDYYTFSERGEIFTFLSNGNV